MVQGAFCSKYVDAAWTFGGWRKLRITLRRSRLGTRTRYLIVQGGPAHLMVCAYPAG